MNRKILYMGDTMLNRQAGYLAGIMTLYDIDYDYIPSDSCFNSTLLEENYGAMIISDYPASNFAQEHLDEIALRVSKGMGIIMIGGWESFVGSGGNYNETILSNVLPVSMKSTDDRYNTSNPCIVIKENDHKIVDSLTLSKAVPTIAGLNEVRVRPGAELLLSAYEYIVNHSAGEISWELHKKHPLLVIGSYGLGRTAAFTSDVAPHWSGSLVDWGSKRISAMAAGGERVEIGNRYAEFFCNIIKWLLNG